MRNSTRAGELLAVAVQTTDDPLRIALLAMFVETVLVTGWRLKVAVQFFPAFIVSEPSLQSVSPVHPAKTDPEPALAVRATIAPLLKVPEQVVPQLMPAGELDTVPVPVPVFATARENVCIVTGVVAQASGL